MQSAPTLQEIQRLTEHGRGRTGVLGLVIGLGARTTPEAATELPARMFKSRGRNKEDTRKAGGKHSLGQE